MSKVLKRNNEYKVVSPLPKEWLSKEVASRYAGENSKFKSSFENLNRLLEDGWKFCSRQEMKTAKSKQERPNKNTRKKQKNKDK